MENMNNKAFQVKTGGLLHDRQIVYLVVWAEAKAKANVSSTESAVTFALTPIISRFTVYVLSRSRQKLEHGARWRRHAAVVLVRGVSADPLRGSRRGRRQSRYRA